MTRIQACSAFSLFPTPFFLEIPRGCWRGTAPQDNPHPAAATGGPVLERSVRDGLIAEGGDDTRIARSLFRGDGPTVGTCADGATTSHPGATGEMARPEEPSPGWICNSLRGAARAAPKKNPSSRRACSASMGTPAGCTRLVCGAFPGGSNLQSTVQSHSASGSVKARTECCAKQLCGRRGSCWQSRANRVRKARIASSLAPVN